MPAAISFTSTPTLAVYRLNKVIFDLRHSQELQDAACFQDTAAVGAEYSLTDTGKPKRSAC